MCGEFHYTILQVIVLFYLIVVVFCVFKAMSIQQ